MIEDLNRAALTRGLKIHSGKTKVLTNEAELRCRRLPDHLNIADVKYEVLGADASSKYLGRKVAYTDPHGTEFNNRVAAAWGTFSKHKKELIDKNYPLKIRLKLFDAVVTSSLLYGSETWALKAEQERRLKTTQRKMMRMILNAKRRTLALESCSEHSKEDGRSSYEEQEVLEPWPEFLKRTAEAADRQAKNAGILEWSVACRRRKWKWAQGLLTTGNSKWSSVATSWKPTLHSSVPANRSRSRPKKRWTDDIELFIKKKFPEERRPWQELAKDLQWWRKSSEMYENFGQ